MYHIKRPLRPRAYASMPPNQFVRQFRTLSFNLGRRSGHTTFIKLNSKPGDLIFCPPGLHHESVFRFSEGKVTTAERLRSDIDGKEVGDVWVDEPTIALGYMRQDKWAGLVERMKPGSFIIMLGYLPMPGPV
jgi:hypothetical protein